MALNLHSLPWVDRLILGSLLAVALLLFILLGRSGPGSRVVVVQDGRTVFTSPLAAERNVVLPGPLGETVLAISGGSARITASSCAHRICQGMGGIQAEGELIACVPNRLLVQIAGGEEDARDYDLLSR